jgi:hypothetical protein
LVWIRWNWKGGKARGELGEEWGRGGAKQAKGERHLSREKGKKGSDAL